MTKHFRRELETIKKRVLTLGSLVEDRVRSAVKALEEMDGEAAAEIVRLDYEVDEMEVEIEEECLKVLALHQPVAVDLRFIIAVIKINNELERIGDQAVNIAQRVLELNPEPQLKPYIDLPRMAEIAREMIRGSLDAFVREDCQLANSIRRKDSTIDTLNEQIFRELLTFMLEDARTIHRALLIMQVSKNLERIADHAKGIADMVVYMVTGINVRHQWPGETPDDICDTKRAE
jgi:phosphate transport system protein